MRRLGPAAFLLLMAAACGSVQREESPPEDPVSEDPVSEVPVSLFRVPDSLAMAGMPDQAEQRLLQVLRSHPLRRDEVLFRLLGIHHGQAAESEFLSILDSLEMAWSIPLDGWKISALDLSGRPDQAAIYSGDSDAALSAWLKWESDSIATLTPLPDTTSPGQVFCMVMSAPLGSLTRTDLQRAAGYAPLFPSLNSRLLFEVAGTDDTLGTWRIALLEGMDPSAGRDLLLAQLMAGSDSGGIEYWLRSLEGQPPVAAVAAGELVRRFPGMYSPRWEVADLLVSLDQVDLAVEYSSPGDAWHRTGTEMAVLLQEKRYDDLLRLTESPGAGAPDSLLARASLYRAHALRGAGRGAGTYYDAYLEFAREYPWHPFAREAAYNAGKYHDCEQEWNPGAEAYMVSLQCSGSFGGDERAHWRGGFCLYMSGRYAEADSLWTLGCDKWPAGYWWDEMVYWRARLADDSGETALGDSLRGILADSRPWEFYGLLASAWSGDGATGSWPAFEIDLLDDPCCSLAVAMTSRGYGVAAAEMLRHSGGGPLETRAAALSLLGRHGGALTLLRILDSELREGGGILPDTLLFLYFPSPYRTLADEATDTLMLESHVLQGIMREESYFDRWVVSSAGAMGVVQLMPTTAYDVARWYGLPFLQEQDFFDPGVSVPYGAIYIDRQYRDFQGQQPLFLAAYNAGPGNATRWVGMHGYDPEDPELYIEQITYRETRIYVKKVLRSAWIYERR